MLMETNNTLRMTGLVRSARFVRVRERHRTVRVLPMAPARKRNPVPDRRRLISVNKRAPYFTISG